MVTAAVTWFMVATKACAVPWYSGRRCESLWCRHGTRCDHDAPTEQFSNYTTRVPTTEKLGGELTWNKLQFITQ
ncbi:unnamed protein product [Acanthoscelides obtectus]|uniref:Secreted protein n=1 Tax=Acanthoscelides obtectus TaxID=200917 RepID=A0A9P0KMF5_ACAOB|nr:unnamed protein product [Acanthoscelides obtectus]CAK1627839.1 hypothetical protein AOBTE_LOCUS4850 [Acanthoscelides obtectus]